MSSSTSNTNRILFEDDFDESALNPDRWCAFYLPHWSSCEASRPSYRVENSVLRLFVAENQPPWCPEFNGPVRVSNLQTGHFCGPEGSAIGQHRFSDGLVVRNALAPVRLFLPHFCRLEMRARAQLGPDNLAALWLIGFEDRPERSGEITIMEVFGHGARGDSTVVGRGIKKINDPDLIDEFVETELPIRVSDWHNYALEWDELGVRFFLDDELISTTDQSPDYPMQLMLNFYDLTGDAPAGDAAWFDIDAVRVYANGRR